MAGIDTNYFNPVPQEIKTQPFANAYPYATSMPQEKTLKDEFVSQHKKNGLVERLYNGIKNLTGLGTGSKKVKQAIAKAESGEIDEASARNTIDKYRKSQANSAQVIGDAVSMAGGIATFLKLKEKITKEGPSAYLRKKLGIIKDVKKSEATKGLDFFAKKGDIKMSESALANAFKNPKGRLWLTALLGMFSAGFAKFWFGIINRIGAKEFYTDKKDFKGAVNPYDKAAYSQVRKENRRERRSANWKNFLSGMINGVTIPVMGLVGGLVGVPLYFAINSLNRYFVGNHVEDEKSFSNYFKNIKENGFLGATLALGVGIPVVLKTHKLSVFDKYSRRAVKKLERAALQQPESAGVSNYEKLSDILFKDKDIQAVIAKDKSMSGSVLSWEKGTQSREELQDLAQELIDTNFFAGKFKQISNDGSNLANIIKEDCRPTRTVEKAQEYLDKCFGKGEYTLVKDHYCLGVGSVAETYNAVGKDGKGVCIKVVKEGMNAEKIKKDADTFRALINSATDASGNALSEAEKKVLMRNVDDLEKGVMKELDLKHEFDMANNLAQNTQFANVVKGIKVSSDNNAYVMERAKGISLESLMNLNEAFVYKDNLIKLKNGEKTNSIFEALDGQIASSVMESRTRGDELQRIIKEYQENRWEKDATEKTIKKIDEYIDRVKRKTPEFSNDIRLEPEDIKNLISEYQQVLVEQYCKIGTSNKFIHADIHPANIFVDVTALKDIKAPGKVQQVWSDLTGKVNRKNHDVFTLIDTGNVIELTKEQSISLLNLTSYIEHGNYQKIAEYVMQGVEGEALGGHTKEEATKIVSDALKDKFTNTTDALEIMTRDNVIKLTSDIMKKHNIVPNDTQLNLNKAIQSADNSYVALVKGLTDGRLADFSLGREIFGSMVGRTTMGNDSKFILQTKKNMEKAQELENLKNLSAAERRHQKKLDGNLKENQEEYHIYKLKQGLYNKDSM